MIPLLLALSLPLAVAKQAPSPWKGMVCFEDARSRFEVSRGSCSATEGERLPLKPRIGQRRFLWISEDERRLVLGVVPANAALADLNGKHCGRFQLALAGDRSHGWPVPVNWTLYDLGPRRTWEFTIPGSTAAKLDQVVLPTGTFRIKLAAAHHRSITKEIVSKESARPLLLGRFTLPPAPSILGKVIEAKGGKPLVGASIESPDGEALASTGDDGRFRIELEGDPPRFLLVERSGYGSRTVALPGAGSDISLPVISLFEAATLDVSIERPEGEKPTPLELRLYENPDKRKERRVVASRSLSPGDATVEFENLSAGDYALVIKGKRPLELTVETVTVEEGKLNRKNVSLTSRPLAGQAFFGDQPAPDVEISLRTGDLWQADLHASATGEFGGPLWQEGRFVAVVTGGPLKVPFPTHGELRGADRIDWDLVIPDRKVHGRVLDAKTHDAVAGATVSIETESPDLHFSYDTTTDPLGEYEFTSVPAGQHRLSAQAEHYVPAAPVNLTLLESDGSRVVDFSLDRGRELAFQVIDASGSPLPNAQILAGVSPLGIERFLTSDADGRFTLALAEGGGETLYVIPREGSFLIASVDSSPAATGDATSPIPLQVPAGLSTLDVETSTETGVPIPGVSLLVRYNGQVIPYPVLNHIASVQGSLFQTGPGGSTVLRNLPSGLYEFWPFRSAQEGLALLSSLAYSPAPAKIGLSAGEQTLTLKFSPKGN